MGTSVRTYLTGRVHAELAALRGGPSAARVAAPPVEAAERDERVEAAREEVSEGYAARRRGAQLGREPRDRGRDDRARAARRREEIGLNAVDDEREGAAAEVPRAEDVAVRPVRLAVDAAQGGGEVGAGAARAARCVLRLLAVRRAPEIVEICSAAAAAAAAAAAPAAAVLGLVVRSGAAAAAAAAAPSAAAAAVHARYRAAERSGRDGVERAMRLPSAREQLSSHRQTKNSRC